MAVAAGIILLPRRVRNLSRQVMGPGASTRDLALRTRTRVAMTRAREGGGGGGGVQEGVRVVTEIRPRGSAGREEGAVGVGVCLRR